MNITAEIWQLLKVRKLDLVQMGVLARKLGIDADGIRTRHYQNMRAEFRSEIDRHISMSNSESNLSQALEYLKIVKPPEVIRLNSSE